MHTTNLFAAQRHPFVWSREEERAEILKNVNEPLWAQFLQEATAHFQKTGGVQSKFPAWCHGGDLDEIMAVSVLAYVTKEKKYFQWMAQWLRELTAYFQQSRTLWEQRLYDINMYSKPYPEWTGNPRQYFEGFSGPAYWVEAGLMSCVLHMYDLLEWNSPTLLTNEQKRELEAALAHFSGRFAFHEEAVKYDNRALWANGGLFISALVEPDPVAAALLIERVHSRHEELRSTFFDDGWHVEGSPIYHAMTLDGWLQLALTASSIYPKRDYLGATRREPEGSVFLGTPDFARCVHAYLDAAIAAEIPRENPRGVGLTISESPVQLRPFLCYVYRQTRDPQVGWFIKQLQDKANESYLTPLRVRNAALLGLGSYTPLLNFWLYRPITNAQQPGRKFTIFKDYGGLSSRSGTSAQPSFLWAHFGYEGMAKANRDACHVALSVDGRELLADPFPRIGPPGNDSALFHNVVVLDRHEQPPCPGRLLADARSEHGDAFLMQNQGGEQPNRAILHCSRAEPGYWWFREHKPLTFLFQRAAFHLFEEALVLVDRVQRITPTPTDDCVDWFFQSPLTPSVSVRAESVENYTLTPRLRFQNPTVLPVKLRGTGENWLQNRWTTLAWEAAGRRMLLQACSVDGACETHWGSHVMSENKSSGLGVPIPALEYHFLRARTHATTARLVTIWSWSQNMPEVETLDATNASIVKLRLRTASRSWNLQTDFQNISLSESAS